VNLDVTAAVYLCLPNARLLRSSSHSHDVFDVLHQRIDGHHASRRIGPGPPSGAEACTHLPFRLFSEIAHRVVDHRDACSFGDGVASGTKDPRVGALMWPHRAGALPRGRGVSTPGEEMAADRW
jgi:hypothetical protein